MLAGINLIINELLRAAQIWRMVSFHGPDANVTRHLRTSGELEEPWGDHWVQQPDFATRNLKISEEKGIRTGIQGSSTDQIASQMWTAQRKKRGSKAHHHPHNFTLAFIQQTFLKHLLCSGIVLVPGNTRGTFPLAPPPNTRGCPTEVPQPQAYLGSGSLEVHLLDTYAIFKDTCLAPLRSRGGGPGEEGCRWRGEAGGESQPTEVPLAEFLKYGETSFMYLTGQGTG